MVLDSLSSPHRRNQNTFFSSLPKKQSSRDEAGTWVALLERHRFLLTMLVVLVFLCTVYLYFAVTLGANNSCSGLSGTQRTICEAKSSLGNGKLKFL
ncbi:ephrin-A3 protein [Carex rostrata]